MGIINVYHDRRQYNFTYRDYDYQAIVAPDDKRFGYSFGVNDRGDFIVTSLVQNQSAVGYVKMCMVNEYYFDGTCYQCQKNYLSQYWQA